MNAKSEKIDIGAVIVTFNRLDKLKKALKAFSDQQEQPLYLLVVDNASTDGTTEYLKEWQKIEEGYSKYVIFMDNNSGGSGGFYAGLKKALSLNAEWIWVSDDDAYPDRMALYNAKLCLEELKRDEVSAICGAVIHDNQIDTAHRRRITNGIFNIKDEPVSDKEYSQKSFEINAFSYVGTIINREKMQKVGVTNRDYFIWFDDTEHSLRLSRAGKIICFPQICVYHDAESNNKEYLLDWKTYYGARNIIDTYKKHFPFRCFVFVCFGRIVKSYYRDIINEKKSFNVVARQGIFDGAKGKLGMHSVYKPGWKPQ